METWRSNGCTALNDFILYADRGCMYMFKTTEIFIIHQKETTNTFNLNKSCISVVLYVYVHHPLLNWGTFVQSSQPPCSTTQHLHTLKGCFVFPLPLLTANVCADKKSLHGIKLTGTGQSICSLISNRTWRIIKPKSILQILSWLCTTLTLFPILEELCRSADGWKWN